MNDEGLLSSATITVSSTAAAVQLGVYDMRCGTASTDVSCCR